MTKTMKMTKTNNAKTTKTRNMIKKKDKNKKISTTMNEIDVNQEQLL